MSHRRSTKRNRKIIKHEGKSYLDRKNFLWVHRSIIFICLDISQGQKVEDRIPSDLNANKPTKSTVITTSETNVLHQDIHNGTQARQGTFPKIVFFLSSQSQRSRVIKNWLPFEWGVPALAHANKPLWLNLRREWNSSENGAPYMLSPPANWYQTIVRFNSEHHKSTNRTYGSKR